MAAKYHYTLESVWVARKQGCKTGYGKTPADALKAIRKAEAEKREEHRRLERAHQLYADHYKSTHDSDQAEIKRLTELLKQRPLTETEHLAAAADSFVMMAMVYFQTTDPRAALKMAQAARQKAGAVVKMEDYDTAAYRVGGYWKAWQGAFGAKEAEQGQ